MEKASWALAPRMARAEMRVAAETSVVNISVVFVTKSEWRAQSSTMQSTRRGRRANEDVVAKRKASDDPLRQAVQRSL